MNHSYNFKNLFLGYQKTPLLWNSNKILDIDQYSPKHTPADYSLKPEVKKLRLGKWVEKFVIHQLNNDYRIEVIAENVQIKNEKITIGELDVLFLEDDKPIHLEIVYKFYLYDEPIESENPLDKWIGPNRNDTLVYKLKKLKEKQLPLLYQNETQYLLTKHDIEMSALKQHVCFKAQLFIPFHSDKKDISPLNTLSVIGWFISFDRIHQLENYEFYIPKKLEWLSEPILGVKWQSFLIAKEEISNFIENGQSPLCWLKNSKNELLKCFITWW
ncbi:DUF1853 family protein [Winogradskyella sp.]|uniref:DUF1853 family protein n=1 Tax=Winogradskyella sp. TaxID=1883156 RepID=UPI003F6ADBD0